MMKLRILVSAFIFFGIKAISHVLFSCRVKWLAKTSENPWDEDVRLIAFMNHTSLYEPLFVMALPYKFLWRFVNTWTAPGADKTLNRPIVGFFWKILAPTMTTITRKRDQSWVEYMNTINPNSMIVIAPEGRMKRPNGLDSFGKPMTVRGGIADIIKRLDSGKMALAYSGGLHHVQKPGQLIPNIFKTININIEMIDIADYKKKFAKTSEIVKDFQDRLEKNCPAQ